MKTGQTTVACKLTRTSIDVILRGLIQPHAVSFAHALLTTAYNGEDWYFVSENMQHPLEIKYAKQIMTKEELDKQFAVDWEHPNSMWFRITKK
jgi:hypothetical protein